jgi:FkbM family methyltransferase
MREAFTHFIGKVPLAGNALRWWANQYPEGSIVKIRQGNAANLLWKRHHRYVNGYWIGHYEFPIQEALKRLLRAGDIFFDVGANAGFFTLVASTSVGSEGRCIAFDPSPENARSIGEQLSLNSLKNCHVVMEAIADCEGEATFSFVSAGSSEAHLGDSRDNEASINVRVTTLDNAVRRFGNPDLIKMDVEGAEGRALVGAEYVLNHIRPLWLIELHGIECEREVKKRMLAANYNFYSLNGERIENGSSLPEHFVAQPSER